MPYPNDIISAPAATPMGGYDLGLYPQFADLLQNIAAAHRAKRQFDAQMAEKQQRDAEALYTKQREYGTDNPYPSTQESVPAPMGSTAATLAGGLIGPRQELANNLAIQRGRPVSPGLGGGIAAAGVTPPPVVPNPPLVTTTTPGGVTHTPGLRDIEAGRKGAETTLHGQALEEAIRAHDQLNEYRQKELERLKAHDQQIKEKDATEKKAERVRKIVNDEAAPFVRAYGTMPDKRNEPPMYQARLMGWRKAAEQSDDRWLKLVPSFTTKKDLNDFILDSDVSGIAKEYALERLNHDATLK